MTTKAKLKDVEEKVLEHNKEEKKTKKKKQPESLT